MLFFATACQSGQKPVAVSVTQSGTDLEFHPHIATNTYHTELRLLSDSAYLLVSTGRLTVTHVPNVTHNVFNFITY